MPLELKMKLRMTDAGSADYIFDSEEFHERSRGKFPARQMTLRYYDTEDGDLRERGWSLLLRDEGDRTVAALRTAPADTSDSYLFAREEWQVICRGIEDGVDGLVEDGAPKKLYDIIGGKPLAEQCRLDIMRRGEIIEPADGLLISVFEDVGTLSAADKSEPLHELEITQLFGRSEELEPFVDRMFQEIPGIERERLSKYERALRLIRSRNK